MDGALEKEQRKQGKCTENAGGGHACVDMKRQRQRHTQGDNVHRKNDFLTHPFILKVYMLEAVLLQKCLLLILKRSGSGVWLCQLTPPHSTYTECVFKQNKCKYIAISLLNK